MVAAGWFGSLVPLVVRAGSDGAALLSAVSLCVGSVADLYFTGGLGGVLRRGGARGGALSAGGRAPDACAASRMHGVYEVGDGRVQAVDLGGQGGRGQVEAEDHGDQGVREFESAFADEQEHQDAEEQDDGEGEDHGSLLPEGMFRPRFSPYIRPRT